MPTKVIDNFQGSYTLYRNGDLNSGRSYEEVTAGINPFIKPGELTWAENATLIDSGGSVITDLILAGKERVESGILYVYCIGHTGRVYKIQVNDPTTYNPDYDNPVLLTTLAAGSPTFTRGGFIDFFGATEKIYIGHDKGVTTINFDGTSEAAVSGTWTQTVPRPLKQFVGKLYIGNGSNIAEIDSTATVTSSTKLSPGFPTNSQVRDIDVSVEGNYIDIVVSNLALGDITSTAQQTISTANSGSYIFKWNGIDIGYTSFLSFPSYSLTANTLFQNHQYTFGFDQFGGAIYAPTEKIISFPSASSPFPNAIASTGNLLFYMVPTYFNGVLETDLYAWGSNDFEVGRPLGFWDVFFRNATSPETDIISTPLLLSVSNAGLGASSNGYTNNLFGTSKFYFSTLESSSAPTTKYRLYKLKLVTSTQIASDSACDLAYYQTQTQLFSKKVNVKEVRIYSEPWITNNSLTIDLIGSDGNAITNASKTFTAGSNVTVGDDLAAYNPQHKPTYALGVGITNLGTKNMTIRKIELDIEDAGK